MDLKFCISNKLPGGVDAENPWHFIFSFPATGVTFHPITDIYKCILCALLGTKLLENRL